MTLGGTNVWTNFSYGYRSESPSGWLLNPSRNKLNLFVRNKKSLQNSIKILVYTYYADDFGKPLAIKSSSQLPLEDAWNIWHDLQLEGWTLEENELL